MLRRHFDQCESCARELAQFERAVGAMESIETIEPSPDFQNRVEEAFLRAHPQFSRAKPRFRLLAAASIAAGVIIVLAGTIAILKAGGGPGDHDKMGHIAPAPVVDDDPQYRTLPKTDLPSKIDASAWGEALAYDQRILGRFQGTDAWDSPAVLWLATHQEADGSWRGMDAGETVELTGLAVLALAQSEECGLALRKGVAFLRSRQRDSGAIGGGSPDSHAIATLALQEAAIRTKDAGAIRAASKGINLIAQQNHDGPWGQGVVAGWQYHVLRLAVASGDRALTQTLVLGQQGLSRRDTWERLGPADRAAALRAELWANPTPDRARWASDAAWLLDRSPLPGTEPANFQKNDLRLAYFGSALLCALGGDAWTKWWSPLQAKLLKTQSPDGSWPEGIEPGKGQIYVTALATLILQTPRRVPPLDE
jgi:hypothetical protein